MQNLSLKNNFIYFFSFLFLTSKIGMSLNFHFCGDNLYQISSLSDPKVCEMHSSYSENEKDSFEINLEDCCDDQIVFVGVASSHREDAFLAAQYIMDFLKNEAPFWKKQKTQHGDGWISSRKSDLAAINKWK